MLLYTTLIFIGSITLFVNFAPTFGDSPKGISKDKINLSPNFSNGKFKNLHLTRLQTNDSQSRFSPIKEFLFGNKSIRSPKKPISSVKIDLSKFSQDKDSIVWLGHSTVLIRTSNVTILTDPAFNRASPISFLGPNLFLMKNLPKAKDLPTKIDVVLISHDHYDHLDYKAIKQIHLNVGKFLVPLGVKSHLVKWGVLESKIEEYDWHESINYKDVNFTFAPTQHFSGRGITNRDSTLWGSWIIKSKSQNMYFSGDGGYFDGFKKIGEEFGPFDIAFVECGAYNEGWRDVHMFPEQSVQASLDLRAKVAMPIHWGKFDLSTHSWTDPIERFTKEAKNKNLSVATPIIGQIFTTNPSIPQTRWWEE